MNKEEDHSKRHTTKKSADQKSFMLELIRSYTKYRIFLNRESYIQCLALILNEMAKKKKVQNGITRGDLLLSLLQNDVSAKALPGPNGTICEPF